MEAGVSWGRGGGVGRGTGARTTARSARNGVRGGRPLWDVHAAVATVGCRLGSAPLPAPPLLSSSHRRGGTAGGPGRLVRGTLPSRRPYDVGMYIRRAPPCAPPHHPSLTFPPNRPSRRGRVATMQSLVARPTSRRRGRRRRRRPAAPTEWGFGGFKGWGGRGPGALTTPRHCHWTEWLCGLRFRLCVCWRLRSGGSSSHWGGRDGRQVPAGQPVQVGKRVAKRGGNRKTKRGGGRGRKSGVQKESGDWGGEAGRGETDGEAERGDGDGQGHGCGQRDLGGAAVGRTRRPRAAAARPRRAGGGAATAAAAASPVTRLPP